MTREKEINGKECIALEMEHCQILMNKGVFWEVQVI